MFAAVLPIAILIQLVRSRRLPPERRHLGADLLEAAGLAFAMSSIQLVSVFPPLWREGWHSTIAFTLLFAAIYFPTGYSADRIRERKRA